jgi:hypothetical protein
VTGPSNRALFETTQISLSCVFEGVPAPNITWKYLPFNQTEPVLLINGDKHQTSSSVNLEEGSVYYTITSVLGFTVTSVADAGMYTCSADNGVVNLIGAISNGTGLLYFEENGESKLPTPCTRSALAGSNFHSLISSMQILISWKLQPARWCLLELVPPCIVLLPLRVTSPFTGPKMVNQLSQCLQ